MKKKILFICIVFNAFITTSYAQILNQDASGKSSILTQGTSLNFNITETQIQATHYGGFTIKGKDVYNTGLWGIDVKAKNNTGVGNLFDSGKFTPEGAFSATIGFRHINFMDDNVKTLNKSSKDQEPKDQKESLKYVPNTITYWYLRGGAGASQFTYDKGAMFSDYSARFMDTTSVSYYFELGVSHQWKKNFIGLNLGYSRQDNMNALTSADYSYSYQDTSVNTGKLTKQKSFTAYSGNYGFYGKIYLNADYQHLITIDTSKYLSIGPYVRWSHNLNAADLAKDNTVLGVSFNYLDGKAGKFLGGIYLQSSDITGKTQPLFNKTIQFGLIAKFNLSSLYLY